VIDINIIVATDSFKGSISTLEAADSIERGIRKVYPSAEIIKIPVADGGEGTVKALVKNSNGIFKTIEVTGPLGDKIKAEYGIINGNTAIIEMAAASGLTLVSEDKRNPMLTTTYGTGQLIKDALDEGCKKILIGIGGSATNDGGVGMAQALGVSFKDSNGNELAFGGGSLDKLEMIDCSQIDNRIENVEIVVACDVTNPLCGVEGASAIYGPQKGADKLMVELLDKNLSNFASKIKEQLGKDVSEIPGAGAAGGLGAGLLAFCNAEIQSGIDMVLSLVEFEKLLESADLVITGEGKIDGQSVKGKVPYGIGKIAKKFNVPVIAIVGTIGENSEKMHDYGIKVIVSIAEGPITLMDAMDSADELIEKAAERVMRIIKIGQTIRSEED
jgi:glycerate kinase